MANLDLVIRGGEAFDGTGAAPTSADVGIRDGKVAAVAPGPPEGTRTTDARGKWVVPGLLDVHRHYDAEVLLSLGLCESVRHGTTSIILGNCSLSTVYSDADDCGDMFPRVEALPGDIVNDALKEAKTWNSPAEYTRALDFAKLEGTRYPAGQLPSTYATWSEFRALNNVLRKRGRVHQSTPNLAPQIEVARYLAESLGHGFRRPLKSQPQRRPRYRHHRRRSNCLCRLRIRARLRRRPARRAVFASGRPVIGVAWPPQI